MFWLLIAIFILVIVWACSISDHYTKNYESNTAQRAETFKLRNKAALVSLRTGAFYSALCDGGGVGSSGVHFV